MTPEQALQLTIFESDSKTAYAEYQSSVTVDMRLEIDQFQKLQSIQQSLSICYTREGSNRLPPLGVVSRILHVASHHFDDIVKLRLRHPRRKPLRLQSLEGRRGCV